MQGDGERLEAVQDGLVARHPQILTAIIRDESYSAARDLLGTSLHTIQKFYSHSTWVEQGHTAILDGLAIPGYDLAGLAGPDDDVCTPCSSPEVLYLLYLNIGTVPPQGTVPPNPPPNTVLNHPSNN